MAIVFEFDHYKKIIKQKNVNKTSAKYLYDKKTVNCDQIQEKGSFGRAPSVKIGFSQFQNSFQL